VKPDSRAGWKRWQAAVQPNLERNALAHARMQQEEGRSNQKTRYSSAVATQLKTASHRHARLEKEMRDRVGPGARRQLDGDAGEELHGTEVEGGGTPRPAERPATTAASSARW